jgi:hypothetical protein
MYTIVYASRGTGLGLHNQGIITPIQGLLKALPAVNIIFIYSCLLNTCQLTVFSYYFLQGLSLDYLHENTLNMSSRGIKRSSSSGSYFSIFLIAL